MQTYYITGYLQLFDINNSDVESVYSDSVDQTVTMT